MPAFSAIQLACSEIYRQVVCRQWVESVHRSRLKSITFIFVPYHVNVKGNEKADSLASTATVAGGRVMDQTDVLNVIKYTGRAENSEGKLDSTSLS